MACHCFNSCDAIWQFLSWPSLVLVMAYCHSVPNHYLNQWWLIVSLALRNQTQVKFRSKSYYYFHSRKQIWKCLLQNVGHFVQATIHQAVIMNYVVALYHCVLIGILMSANLKGSWNLIIEWLVNNLIKTLRPTQNGRHFAKDIFKCTFWNEKYSNFIVILLKFVSQGAVDNKWACRWVSARKM